MKIRKKMVRAGILGAAALLAAGCGRKVEEEVRNQITIPSYNAGNVNCGYVRRGDLEHVESLFLQMTATQEQELSFGVSGLPYGKVYVKEGDYVEAGELLAELECDEIKEEMTTLQAEAKRIQLDIDRTGELLAQARQKKDKNNKEKEANQDVISRYLMQLQELENDRQNNAGKMQEQREKLQKRQIYADMSGVVSKVANVNGNAVSDEKQTFITLQSAEQVLTGKTKAENDFTQGQEVQIIAEEEEYPASILFVERQDGETAIEVELEEGYSLPEGCTYAQMEWSNGVEKDVLYVPGSAVVISREQSYVYVLEEDGFPSPVEVETGTVSGEYTQIESGLNEGDTVVLY